MIIAVRNAVTARRLTRSGTGPETGPIVKRREGRNAASWFRNARVRRPGNRRRRSIRKTMRCHPTPRAACPRRRSLGRRNTTGRPRIIHRNATPEHRSGSLRPVDAKVDKAGVIAMTRPNTSDETGAPCRHGCTVPCRVSRARRFRPQSRSKLPARSDIGVTRPEPSPRRGCLRHRRH